MSSIEGSKSHVETLREMQIDCRGIVQGWESRKRTAEAAAARRQAAALDHALQAIEGRVWLWETLRQIKRYATDESLPYEWRLEAIVELSRDALAQGDEGDGKQ